MSEIVATFQQVASEQGKRLAPLTPDLHLLNSGLDSLCFAVIVARLEEKLDRDPFGMDGNVRFPVTFGEFVELYERIGA